MCSTTCLFACCRGSDLAGCHGSLPRLGRCGVPWYSELIAQRIVRFANLVGREHVIAGSDCGFAQGAGLARQPADIVWAKFDALAEGAEIASRRLWKH